MAMHTYMPRPPGADEAGLGDQHTCLDYIVSQLSQKSNRTKKKKQKTLLASMLVSILPAWHSQGYLKSGNWENMAKQEPSSQVAFGCGILSQQ